jgi:hypothetical protein
MRWKMIRAIVRWMDHFKDGGGATRPWCGAERKINSWLGHGAIDGAVEVMDVMMEGLSGGAGAMGSCNVFVG